MLGSRDGRERFGVGPVSKVQGTPAALHPLQMSDAAEFSARADRMHLSGRVTNRDRGYECSWMDACRRC